LPFSKILTTQKGISSQQVYYQELYITCKNSEAPGFAKVYSSILSTVFSFLEYSRAKLSEKEVLHSDSTTWRFIDASMVANAFLHYFSISFSSGY
jgi:hypothetical protein